MRFGRINVVSFCLIVLVFGVAVAFYGRLPDPVPIHWHGGEADSWMSKPWGVFIVPLVTAGVFALMAATPHISPARFHIDRFRDAYGFIQLTFIGVLSLVALLTLLAAGGVALGLDRIIHTAVGLLLIVLGNFMSKFTRNFFIGIRTPWTLASEEVWFRTHRLGGRLFVVAGLILVLTGLLGGGGVPVFVAAGIAAGIPYVYSYIVYRRLGGRHGHDQI